MGNSAPAKSLLIRERLKGKILTAAECLEIADRKWERPYRFMQKMVFCLVDEVLDAGDALVVRNGGQEERISLSDIKNVNYSPYESAAGHPFAAAAHRVRRHGCFLCTCQHSTDLEQPGHQRLD